MTELAGRKQIPANGYLKWLLEKYHMTPVARVAKGPTYILDQVPVLPEHKDQVQLFVTPWTTSHQASLLITNSWSLLKFISIKLVMPSNHLILCRPLCLLPSIFPSTRVFSNESVLCIRWSKYWSFSFSISPSNEYSRLISFRTDLFDLLVVQGHSKVKRLFSTLQFKSIELQSSAFFMVQISHPHMTTVSKVISLLLDMLGLS